MERIVRTSAGWLALNVERVPRHGAHVNMTAFDETSGWQRANDVWLERRMATTLPAVVAEVRGIGAQEAEQIATETLAQWRARGGDELTREDRGIYWATALIFGIAAIGALAAVALVLWLTGRW